MAEIGKFVWNNTSANLSCSIDMKTRIVRIESIDPDGYDFLFRLNVGREITSYSNKGDVISIMVQSLTGIGARIEGQAIFFITLMRQHFTPKMCALTSSYGYVLIGARQALSLSYNRREQE